jgi:hypothetical protein
MLLFLFFCFLFCIFFVFYTYFYSSCKFFSEFYFTHQFCCFLPCYPIIAHRNDSLKLSFCCAALHINSFHSWHGFSTIISIRVSHMQLYSSTLMMETAGSTEILLPDYTSCPRREQFFSIIIYLYFNIYLCTFYFLGLPFHENEGIMFLHNISSCLIISAA